MWGSKASQKWRGGVRVNNTMLNPCRKGSLCFMVLKEPEAELPEPR